MRGVPPSMTADVRRAVGTVFPAWIAARVVALCCLGITALVHGGSFPQAGSRYVAGSSGWWSWDAAWYRSLAEHGYAGSPPGGVRFFPLFPLLGRWLGFLLGGHDGVALILLANVFALAFGAAVVLLTERELDRSAAATAGWLTMLAPGAVVLATAFAEPLSGLLGAVFLLLVRGGGRAMWWAVPVGVLAGLTRPTGFLLAAVPVIEYLVVAGRRREWPPLLAAAAGPVVGTGIFCAWTARAYDDALAPYHAQTQTSLRGGIVANPIHALFVESSHKGLPVPLRVVVVLATIALVVLAWRLLPASIAVWATLLALAALTSARLTSLPRYVSGDFPLLMALAAVVQGRRAVLTVAASALLFALVAIAGFQDWMVF
jgi:hypothetical protein